jgi:beta-glucosidase
VVVLVAGRVLALPWIAEHATAIVQAWLPGEEGGNGLADLLFGRVEPSGRLPVSVPRAVGQVPIHAGRKWERDDALGFGADYSDLEDSPLFPFGAGLSYTRFEYGALAVSPERAAQGEPVRIELELANAGTRPGAELVQLYVRDEVASTTRPLQQLVGFARVPLAPGERRRVGFELDPGQLALYDAEMRLVVEPGHFQVRVGASSADIRASARFEIEGPAREVSPRGIAPTRSELGPVRRAEEEA